MKNIIEKTNIKTLTLGSSIIPIVLLVLWAFLYGTNAPSILNFIVIAFCSFMAGTGGLFQIIKREAPGIMGGTVKGIWAIISGALYLMFFWGLSTIGLVLVFMEGK